MPRLPILSSGMFLFAYAGLLYGWKPFWLRSASSSSLMIGAASSSLAIQLTSSRSHHPLRESPGTRSGHPSYRGWYFFGNFCPLIRINSHSLSLATVSSLGLPTLSLMNFYTATFWKPPKWYSFSTSSILPQSIFSSSDCFSSSSSDDSGAVYFVCVPVCSVSG